MKSAIRMSCAPALREAAVQRDAATGRPFDLADLWRLLTSGAWVFRDTFETDERYLAVLQPAALLPARPLAPRKLQLLERVLLGAPAKVVAMDNQRSLSSITGSVQFCIRAMGLSTRVSQASVLLTLAARGCLQPDQGRELGRMSELDEDGQSYFVVSALRPDLRLPAHLSLAETAVLRSLLAGNSYAHISGQRATSPRTVANQLATAFRKLGVSGRRAAIAHLIQCGAQHA
jgi:DNA-binding CsgD family transcriptional regulator